MSLPPEPRNARPMPRACPECVTMQEQCMDCFEKHARANNYPVCEGCGGFCQPDAVLFGYCITCILEE